VHFGRQNVSRGQLTALVEETIGGIATVRDYDAGAILCKKFDELDESFRKAGFKATFFSSCVNPSTRFVNNLIYAGVCLAGAIRAVGGFVTVGDLSAFLSYANQYTKPFNDISAVVSELQGSFACSDRVFQLLDQPEVDPDPEGAVVMGKAKGAVEIKDVRFSYVPGREVLHGIKLSAKPGQTIAIVGPTGCGKTTLINLLMRFYDADSGTISVDGVPIEDVTRTSLRANWGMVLQDAWVAGGTVRDNICMGRPDATDEEVRKAAEAASASAFIERLPNGYDTVLEPGGKGLSAGQRQLLCIARVMLARPAMLILDEATSSIDTRTELRVQEAMGKLMEGRTSFVVAHRLSTIRSADLICAMRDGRVVETGTHEELLAKDGFYASLYRAQFEAA
jgi:ATP-binding cassette subfamily B protein